MLGNYSICNKNKFEKVSNEFDMHDMKQRLSLLLSIVDLILKFHILSVLKFDVGVVRLIK